MTSRGNMTAPRCGTADAGIRRRCVPRWAVRGSMILATMLCLDTIHLAETGQDPSRFTAHRAVCAAYVCRAHDDAELQRLAVRSPGKHLTAKRNHHVPKLIVSANVGAVVCVVTMARGAAPQTATHPCAKRGKGERITYLAGRRTRDRSQQIRPLRKFQTALPPGRHRARWSRWPTQGQPK